MKSPSTMPMPPQRPSTSTRPAWALRVALAVACMGCSSLGMAQSFVKLPDPYDVFRTARTDGTWTMEQYNRATEFNLLAIRGYQDSSTTLLGDIAHVERWNKIGKTIGNVVGLLDDVGAFELVMDSKALANLTVILKKPKFKKIKELLSKDGQSELVERSLLFFLYGFKLGLNNGVIDTGHLDIYNILQGDELSKAENALADVVLDDIMGPSLLAGTKVFMEYFADGLSTGVKLFFNGRLTAVSFPYYYMVAGGIKIATDLGSAWALSSMREESERQIYALEFLRYYLISYRGDSEAFEAALGRGGRYWDFNTIVYNFILYKERELLVDGVIDVGALNKALSYYSEVADLVLAYLKNNAALGFVKTSVPSRILSTAQPLSQGEEILVSGDLDPYLVRAGCSIKVVGIPALAGWQQTKTVFVSTRGLTHYLKVAGLDPTLKRDVTVECGPSSLTYAYRIAEKNRAPAGYFGWSTASALQASHPATVGNFTVSFQTPPLRTLLQGQNSESVDASQLRAKFWIKEKTKNTGTASDWTLLTEKEILGYLQNPTDRITVSTGSTTLQGADYQSFFIDRTGQREFKWGATVYGTPYLNEGTGYDIELSQNATIRAADLQFGWQYDPYRLIVADPAAAGYDAGWFSATAGQPFTFCFGQPYDGARGPLQSYRLWLTPDNGGSLGSMVSATAMPYDAATGCGVFSVAASGRYKINGIEALINPAQDPQGEGRVWFGNIPPEYVQVAGADQPSSPGGGTPGGGDPGTPGTHPLNDTGITWSGNYPSGNATTCDASHPAGQDCHYGRDAQAAAGQLTKVGHSAPDVDAAHGNPNGFDYTKISNSGNPLPHTATLGAGASDWACTRDNVTGLIWEVKTTSGLRSQSHTYSWFNTSSPNGNQGTANGGTCETAGRCDTEKYTQDVNAAGLCGANDWRMPTVKELEGIVDRGRSYPAIDPVFFPNTPSSSVWSGSPNAYYSYSAWLVNFNGGFASGSSRYDGDHVRLVRGGQ